METKPTSKLISGVEQDPRLFTWFLTLIMGIMYVVALINNPGLRKPLELGIFSILLVVHVALHWQLEKISERPKTVLWYILLQGALVFSISWLANLEAMVFALYLAMLGESVGLFGLSRRALLAAIFFLVLAFANIQRIIGLAPAGWTLLGIMPVVIFTVIYVTLYMRQADAREKAQALASELESANRQLAQYAAQVEDLTIANERQRMARELHDTLSQGLAGIILQLEAVEAHLANNRPEKAEAIVANAMVQARATLTGARKAIDDLRGASEDDLEQALRAEISRFTAVTGIPCTFKADPMSELSDVSKETVIRAVAEGLNNIARHSRARQASVTVSLEDRKLSVMIQDDGQGFAPDTVPSGHYGLLGIRERVRMANGGFDIQSAAGAGTLIKITLPL